MNYYKIFLASSSELKAERNEFVAGIHNLNKDLREKGVALEVEWWEDVDDAFNTSCKQDDYNEYLKLCHFFVMLIWTKVGKFSNIEYDLARSLNNQNNLPRVYVYEKTTPKDGVTDTDKYSKQAFMDKLMLSGHQQFPTQFESMDTVIGKFKENVKRLFADSYQLQFQHASTAMLLSPTGVSSPEEFMGRKEELNTIAKRLTEGQRLMLINAEGGIGKTTLAARYWKDTETKYKSHAWLYCEEGIMNALKSLAPGIGIDLAVYDTEHEQQHALRIALSKLQDGFLLVLDNANDPDDVIAFREAFEGWQWHVLITSRCNGILPKNEELPIEHLPPELAAELFTKYYNEPDNPAFSSLLSRLLEAIRYNTLLVEVFSKNMAEASQMAYAPLNMKTFLELLEKEGLHLANNSFEVKSEYGTKRKAATTDEILNVLYDFTKLKEAESTALLNISLLPAVPYRLPFLISLFATVETERDYKNTIKALVKTGWLSTSEDTYRLSPVIQKLLLNKHATTLGSDALPLLGRLNTKLENDAYNLLHISLADAKPYTELATELYKCLQKDPNKELATYLLSVAIYYKGIGDLVGEKKCLEYFQEVCRSLCGIDVTSLSYKYGLAVSYCKLGDVYQAKGDWNLALENYQEYNRLEKEVSDSSPDTLEYKYGLAISYGKLGGVYEAKGDWDTALENYQEYNRLVKEVSASSPDTLEYKYGLAISYEKLGGVYHQAKGDWDTALENYQEYNRLVKEVSASSPDTLAYKYVLAISYSRLGGVFEAKGDWDTALENYQECNRLEKEVSDSSPDTLEYKNGLAISYQNLGNVYEAKGSWDMALENYQKFNRLVKEVSASSPDTLAYKNVLAISYLKLGNVYKVKGDWDTALENYQQDLKISKDISDSSPDTLEYKNGLAISYQNLGGVYQAKGDWDTALENYQQELKISKDISDSSPDTLEYKNGLAISYQNLGGVYQAKGDWDTALENYQEYNRLVKEVSASSPDTLEYKNVLAISYLTLGDLYQAKGDWDLALENYQDSWTIFADLQGVTKGQVLLIAYNLGWTTRRISSIVGNLSPQLQSAISTALPAMRAKAYDSLTPFAEKGLLSDGQLTVYEALSDKEG